ncbi:carbohydrate ABC transporter permease [Granulosicoccus antarcticus]|uniref:Trehalose transport system permease protein SugA n=1 Tax=Granulosicoccus antarcticus IMCC3135 TaxID=1192854 RepID=A0A2Z2P1Q2_9GAMM|nr:sugar ABC transporter permease [Granulosicoccus antarcticus]ASJ74407.1 Trehalose transport system permease protein SugA [Granulosicoccus antarcticus IMCC3135]
MTREDPVKHFFLWPAVLIVLVMAIFPLIYSLANSFMSLRLIPPRPARFIGLENYADLMVDERFWQVVSTTSLIAFISVALQFIIGFSIALSLVKRVPGADFFRVSFLLPMLVAPVAVALVARQILNPTMGPLNQLTSFFGFSNLPFLTDTKWALGSLITVEIWQWTPLVILLLLAGLQSLPEDVYEAAELENASAWQQFWSITFPMMLPMSAAVIFIRIVESFKIIDTVFVMTGGGPGISTETLSLYAYQEGFKKFNLGYTSALSFMFLAVVLVISLVYLAILKPYLEKYK